MPLIWPWPTPPTVTTVASASDKMMMMSGMTIASNALLRIAFRNVSSLRIFT